MDYKDIEKAERVLTQLTDTFRAVQYLNDVLASLKPVIGGIAQYEAQLEEKKAALANVRDELARAQVEFIQVQTEKQSLERLTADIRTKLKGVGL